jgi:FixJ family two-component response regulator
MDGRLIIHFVDSDSRTRAEFARLTYALGHHAEVYGSVAELCVLPPQSGVIVARVGKEGVQPILRKLESLGVWLPLVVAAEQSDVSGVVEALQAGALDYLVLPAAKERLAELFRRVHRYAEEHADARKRMVNARSRLSALSPREREVLDWLSNGCSNKAIARALGISPRTVEIHRANMMDKLGASHPVDAVRLKLEAGGQRQ